MTKTKKPETQEKLDAEARTAARDNQQKAWEAQGLPASRAPKEQDEQELLA